LRAEPNFKKTENKKVRFFNTFLKLVRVEVPEQRIKVSGRPGAVKAAIYCFAHLALLSLKPFAVCLA
jgi:hypothetical protein